ncbi:sigma-K factor [Mycobacterium phage Malec]|uniref:Helix-turn-helix DNA binding domain protein n=2 Tax=Turbidovirus TaxID=2948936 RepID=A0A0A0RM77_9CAUD|nr:sigma-K factor [Mycobacterium phage Larenn]YP_010064145.1 sigma-K factor [Mycobacterium phage Malec]AIW02948.1 hypothetical protein PBI_LARENN_53 [Mycobacterium phage Larenn]AZV00848.1 hypothetical protein SEA_MALEC_54 [Mycobacterium phage Malec]
MSEKTNKLFLRAARSALVAWKGDFNEDDELAQELWVWYLESPAVQKKIDNADAALAQTLIRDQALNILAGQALERDLERNIYSSDSVKDALRGESTNRYLLDILPMAMEWLDKKNEIQAEEIRVRYEDGVVPPRGSAAEARLKRAVKSLTQRVNVIAHTAGLQRDEDGNLLDKEGPGSAAAIFPETRKAQGDGHSDPTATIALLLIEHPELRDEYLYEPSLPEFLGGRCHAQPA